MRSKRVKSDRAPLIFSICVVLGVVLLALYERHLISTDSWISVALAAMVPLAMGLAGGYLAAKVLSSGEKWGFIILFSALFAVGVGLAIYQQYRGETALAAAKSRHLTKEQKDGIAKAADSIPQDVGVLVYMPNDSEESKKYGGEIWEVLHAHHKRTSPKVLAAGEDSHVGVWVLVSSSITDPAGIAGEEFYGGISSLGIPAKFGEGYGRADKTNFVLYVGTKPPYD